MLKKEKEVGRSYGKKQASLDQGKTILSIKQFSLYIKEVRKEPMKLI